MGEARNMARTRVSKTPPTTFWILIGEIALGRKDAIACIVGAMPNIFSPNTSGSPPKGGLSLDKVRGDTAMIVIHVRHVMRTALSATVKGRRT